MSTVLRCGKLKENKHGHDPRVEGMVILQIRQYLQRVKLLTLSVCNV